MGGIKHAIQIQHLLKLNRTRINNRLIKKRNSNTTLVKVKLDEIEKEEKEITFKYNTC